MFTIDDDVKHFSDRIHAANQESKIKSRRVLKAHRRLRAAGSAIGRAPWGYEIICEVCKETPVKPRCRDHRKLFVPTAIGSKYVPLIYARVTNGESLRTIAAWLTAEGVQTTNGKPWNEGYLGNRLVKNPVYYGQRRNAGQLETEGLVTYSVWLDANAALSRRVKPGRSTVVREKAMLAPVCGNPSCDATGKHPSPMYRILTGKDRVPYYRCTGSGPQRKGCGFMVALSELDKKVIDAMVRNHSWHIEKVFIPGNDQSAKIGKLRQQAMDAYASGNKTLFLELDAQADELENDTETVSPHWEEKITGQREADYFKALDARLSSFRRRGLRRLPRPAGGWRFPGVLAGQGEMP